MKIAERSNYKPGPKDECGSPYYAVAPLYRHIEAYRKRIGLSKEKFVILEPATGMQRDRKPHIGLAEGLRFLGYKVLALRFMDFTEMSLHEIDQICEKNIGSGYRVRMILTNPPYSVSLKRKFINKCEDFHYTYGLPYALLMSTTTLVEKINGRTLRACSVHVPYGRICYNMPEKGWGTVENPTKATFATNWYSKGLVEPYTIWYDNFDMSDHFEALDRFYNDFAP